MARRSKEEQARLARNARRREQYAEKKRIAALEAKRLARARLAANARSRERAAAKREALAREAAELAREAANAKRRARAAAKKAAEAAEDERLREVLLATERAEASRTAKEAANARRRELYAERKRQKEQASGAGMGGGMPEAPAPPAKPFIEEEEADEAASVEKEIAAEKRFEDRFVDDIREDELTSFEIRPQYPLPVSLEGLLAEAERRAENLGLIDVQAKNGKLIAFSEKGENYFGYMIFDEETGNQSIYWSSVPAMGVVGSEDFSDMYEEDLGARYEAYFDIFDMYAGE